MMNALAGIGATLHKFAFDLRILQSPPIGSGANRWRQASGLQRHAL
ncbi:MAG: hypothetical protein R2867_43425 [Caldilineaceae bacterium]